MKHWLCSLSVASILASGSAFAADLGRGPPPAPLPPLVPVFTWTGFYLGGNVGGGWGELGSTEIAPGTGAFPTGTVFSKHNLSGFVGGGQAGYNWQAGSNFVLGVEGEYSWADLRGTATTVSTVPATLGFKSVVTAKTNDYALATARVGFAANNWLFFLKGGGAWGQGNSSGTGFLANGTVFDTTSSSSNRSGWVIGGGVEWGFARNWSAKIEYDHIDFGSTNLAIHSSTGTTSFVSSTDTVDVVKAGLNYHFN